MSLTDLQVDISYITYGEYNIRDALIIPALKQATTYKRSVGFFSSSVFDTILDGVIDLSRRDGHIQIIASPHLSANDVEAIKLGYEAREKVMKDAFLRDFDLALEKLSDQKLNLTAELIASGVLDIKITDLASENEEVSADGDYHDKLGIIEDDEGNVIVFVGSPNETINGYKKNYEKVRVFKSWNGEQNAYVQNEQQEFDALWNGTNPYLKTYQFNSALREKVLKVKANREAVKSGNAPIKLRDYQEAAINSWVANDYRGFYVMATGTGKTWTAIFSALELQKKHECMIVICAPYKHLVHQWKEDVEKAMPDSTIIMISSENPKWETQLSEAIVKQRIKKKSKIVAISTISSFNLDRFQKTIKKSKQDKLLIVDEAHRFTKRTDEIKGMFKYMLGLSATPFSGKDTAKGKELMEFFGGQVFDLPIEAALDRGFLVPYYYHPIFVNATEDEEDRFRKKSAQMAACYRNGKCIDPDNLVKHHRARLRIISMAEEKIDKIQDILGHVQEKDHFIVYCGDGRLYDEGEEGLRHINFVKRQLDELGFKASQFTASENMAERLDLIDIFNMGQIDSLAAIKCLDEGINIPSIKGALILSSNDDYREFVQRRGRILRTYEGKEYANIYDVVVLPSTSTEKLAEIEFRRFYEYARLAQNADVLMIQLNDLIKDYGLKLEDFATKFEDIKEDELDE